MDAMKTFPYKDYNVSAKPDVSDRGQYGVVFEVKGRDNFDVFVYRDHSDVEYGQSDTRLLVDGEWLVHQIVDKASHKAHYFYSWSPDGLKNLGDDDDVGYKHRTA